MGGAERGQRYVTAAVLDLQCAIVGLRLRVAVARVNCSRCRMLPSCRVATRPSGRSVGSSRWSVGTQIWCTCSRRAPSYSTAAGGREGLQQQGKVPPKHQRLLDVMLGAQTGGWVKKELGLETYALSPVSLTISCS